jgi:hypothetical protein
VCRKRKEATLIHGNDESQVRHRAGCKIGMKISLGLHSLRHTNATAMDSLNIPQQIRKQRLGHSENSVTENYTHTFTQDERDVAEKLGQLFGTGWLAIDKGKVISFPSLSQKEEGLAGGVQQALVNQ